ncbi:MAG TPA: hypothetical protein VLG47_06270 [Candidatus Saccharimonadales bacterium]|nr:hypothetical protein [Candidatus Saccharimonadales bacterium]
MQETRFANIPPSDRWPDLPDDRVAFGGPAEPKNVPPDKDGDGELAAAALAGIKSGDVLAHAGDRYEYFEQRWHEKNDHLPAIVQLWSLTVFEALDEFRKMQAPADGFETVTLNELGLAQSQLSLNAGIRLQSALAEERAVGIPNGPVEQILTTFYREDGYRVIDEEVSRLIEEYKAFLPYGIEEDLLDASTHTMGHDGKLIWLPSIRADAFRMSYRDDDERARLVVSAFTQILKSGQANNPNYLVKLQFDLTGESGSYPVDGIDIIHRTTELIMSGDVILDVDEYKTIPMVGKEYDNYDFNEIWDHHNHDVGQILAYLKDNAESEAYEPWQRKLEHHSLDMAKTADAMFITLMNGCSEYDLRNGISRDKAITKQDLASKTNGNVIWVGLDIRNNGTLQYGPDYNLKTAPYHRLETKAGDEYKLTPDIRRLGVPDKATFGKRTITDKELMDLIDEWEAKVHKRLLDREKKIVKLVRMGRPAHRLIAEGAATNRRNSLPKSRRKRVTQDIIDILF